jgi:signal transduction histidine kinase
LLKQIFSNLLLNGAEAAAVGGWVKVTLQACESPGGWRIEVADSGPGIAETHREKLFAPFFTTKPHGTGLGLALVKKAVHLLEGSICLKKSEKGAVFAVLLPWQLRDLSEEDIVQKKHHVRG